MNRFNQNISPMQLIVLNFLVVETFTTPQIAQQLLKQGTVQATHQMLKRMVKAMLLKQETFPLVCGRGITLYGITEHGLAMSNNDQFISRPSFQRSRVSATTLRHKLDIQHFHVLLIQNGWNKWQDGSQLGRRDRNQKVPDAVAISPKNTFIAFEIEREIKSLKRYRDIILSHLVSRRNGSWDEIIYLCPTSKMAESLQKKIHSIKSINHQGKSINLTHKHHSLFKFYGYEEARQLILNEHGEL